MAGLVVTVSPPNALRTPESRITIFPGGATTMIYPARRSFWLGYGFAADAEDGADLSCVGTRFELDVDGEPASMLIDVDSRAGIPVRKTNTAEFPAGLPAGWHDFTGRWYERGRLVLSSRVSIQFVER